MCGIVGGWWRHWDDDHQALVNRSIEQLSHRGPDDRGISVQRLKQSGLVFGHTRLSIIDLSAAGHQPMQTLDGRFSLVYNGEIYNYLELRAELEKHGFEFRSQTDTEVLLLSWAKWGQDCLKRLKGMFAFAVFDRDANRLTCVRDAFGIKPLFYYWDQNSGFRFSSEIPSLLTLLPLPKALNMQRVYDYLVPGRYDDNCQSFFENINQLPPGHLISFELGGYDRLKLDRWWWPEIAERTDLSFSDAADQLRQMFIDNVRLHLRSDVPIGTALSGGIDSSAIVCAMRYIDKDLPIHTFSYVVPDSPANEEKWVDRIVEFCGCTPHKVVVGPRDLSRDLDDMIHYQGEPFGSTSIYAQYRVFQLAREHGIKVTLDGQGGDELLAGYDGYPGSVMHSMLDRGQLLELLRYLNAWAKWPGRSMRRGIQSAIGQVIPSKLYGIAIRLAGRNPVPDWLDANFLSAQGVKLKWPGARGKTADSDGRRLAASLRAALTGQGLNALLRHGDRNSMRWSIESRVPFLTTDLAEFMLSMPESYLVSREGETKYLFRAAMRGIVPDDVLDRRDKIGFETPEQGWLKNIEHNVFEWLEAASTVPFLREKQCHDKVESMIDGRETFSYQAWRLINFCRWMQVVASQGAESGSTKTCAASVKTGR